MKYLYLLVFYLFISSSVLAQSGKVSPKTNIKKGVLKNGLTYYIYKNPLSRGKVNFYLIQDVGSILEEDNQNGLAHFLEHMAFNGTKNYPGDAIMKMFKAKGLGTNINAYTGLDQTVYHFTGIPSSDNAFCDECLFMLYDWCNNITLEGSKIDAERPVILEEMRTRNNLSFRTNEATGDALYNYSKYGKRNIIGTTEVLTNFKYQEIIDFYETWYHTENQAVVIIGDIDVLAMENKVKNLFSTLPKKENPKERFRISIPDNKETLFVSMRDKEVKGTTVKISFRHPYADIAEDKFTALLINQMLQRRAQQLVKDDKEANDEKTFINVGLLFAPSVSGYSTYQVNTVAEANKMKEALAKVLGMHKDILKNGFTEDEFSLAKERFLTSLKRLKQVKGMSNNQYHFDEIKNNFLNKTDLLDASANLKRYTNLTNKLSLGDITAKLNEWYSGPNKSIIVLGNETDELLTKQEILDIEATCEMLKVVPTKEDKDEVETDKDVLNLGDLKGSSVVKTEKIPELMAEKWTLANGAKVIYKESNLNKNLIHILAESPGGLSVLNGDDLNNGLIFSKLLSIYGIEGLSKEEYENLLQKHKIRSSLVMSQMDEKMQFVTTYTELETAFQILYKRFEQPAFYQDEFTEKYQALGLALKNNVRTYKNELTDTISRIQYGVEKTVIADTNWYNTISLEGLEKVYRDRFQDAGNFTFYIVGGVGKGRAKKLAEKYIGSLTSTGRNENSKVMENLISKGRMQKMFDYETPGNQAGVIYKMNVEVDYSYKNKIGINFINTFLQEQLNEEIRQKQRGTYGVHVTSKITEHTSKNCEIDIRFDCDPERLSELDNILHETIVKLGKEGMDQAFFDRVMKKYDKINAPQASQKQNPYYIEKLIEFEKYGLNTDDDKFLKEQLDTINLEFLNDLFKNIVNESAILDVTYQ